jgi:hypothetical protein
MDAPHREEMAVGRMLWPMIGVLLLTLVITLMTKCFGG